MQTHREIYKNALDQAGVSIQEAYDYADLSETDPNRVDLWKAHTALLHAESSVKLARAQLEEVSRHAFDIVFRRYTEGHAN